MATVRVAPRQWVAMPIPVGTTSAQMAFGDDEPQPAYIENVRGRRDRIETYAKLRCPKLRSGSRVTVHVYHADGSSEMQIQVM